MADLNEKLYAGSWPVHFYYTLVELDENDVEQNHTVDPSDSAELLLEFESGLIKTVTGATLTAPNIVEFDSASGDLPIGEEGIVKIRVKHILAAAAGEYVSSVDQVVMV